MTKGTKRAATGVLLLACIAMAGIASTFAGLAFAQSPPAPGVESFSPRGTTKDVRQVVARFTVPIVAFGDPRLPEPFTVECPRPGRGRWADSRNWVYDFESDLPAGLACEFRLRDSLRALDGRSLSGTRAFSFNTGGPAIRASLPYAGAPDIDAEQVFLLALDAAATPASIAANAFCAVDNIAERIPVNVLAGAERERVLAQRRDLGYAYFNLLRRSGEGAGRPDAEELRAAEALVAVVQCRRAVPPETRVRLVWGAGIAAPSGIATSAEQVLSFRTRDSFTARLSCDRANEDAACLPMLPVRLSFSSPVPIATALAARLTDAAGKHYPASAPGEARMPAVDSVVFTGPFPERGTLTLSLGSPFVDDSGRALANADRFPLAVEFDEYPPLAKFAAGFGILEAGAGGVLPVTLRNVESPVSAARQAVTAGIPARSLLVATDADIARWLKRVQTTIGEQTYKSVSVFDAADRVERFFVPKPGGEREFEVIGIPLKGNGFHVVELSSPRLGKALLESGDPRFVATAALVTNLAVHFKWGREASRVWVTTLDTGRPVRNARVVISGYCRANLLWQGTTDASGIAQVDASLGDPNGANGCYDGGDSEYQPLMVSARTDADMSFVLSSWQEGIEPYAFSVPVGSRYGAEVLHTVLDRTLFRAGETVSMKHFLRRRVSSGFRAAEEAQPTTLAITHSGSEQEYSLPVTFDAGGIAESTWTIPRDARLGEYRLMLSDARNERTFNPVTFRVEQFRVPTMEATLQPPAEPLVNASSTTLDLHVAYLSGGAASDAPVVVRTMVEPRGVSFRDFPEFVFGGERVREGTAAPNEGDDAFLEFATRFGDYASRPAAGSAAPARVHSAVLDKGGAARITIAALPRAGEPHSLVAELEYQDANGERLATATRIPLWPAAISLGIRLDGWAASTDRLSFQVVAVDLAGKPVANHPVRVDLFKRETYSYRKRLIGGFYAYESSTEVQKLPVGCSGRTNARGLVFCEVAPQVDGQVLIQAETRDAANNMTFSTSSAWVVGEGDWWFEPGNADRMDVLPEQKEYQPGQTARFQIRMPFRVATALVTVEREGVIESFVTELSGREPVVEVPIRGDYAPNVFVSVLAIRGRVTPLQSWLGGVARKLNIDGRFETGRETALVDLAKPAFKLGLAQIRVGWSANRLAVTALTDREVYRTRQTANVDVTVRQASGEPLPAGAEIALAVVDEGLLELSPNPSWQLLDAMMGERGLEVWTSTAQMQVVGKRTYGRKAVPPGGGGGRGPARELFDTVLLWEGRVKLDAAGRARIAVPLNDSLSAFRVVAIASAGATLFGTGQTTIRTNQDLMLYSGLPSLVREGDRFTAVYTVRNASERAMTVAVEGGYRHDMATASVALPSQTVDVAAGSARELSWQVEVPAGTGTLQWEVGASERGGDGADRMRSVQQIVAAFPVRTYQATLAQVGEPLSLPIARPAAAIAGRGGVAVSLRATLGDGLDGVREYMSFYLYSCLEQRLSKAVAMRDPALWNSEMARLSLYLDANGLLRYFPMESLRGSDVLTSYVLAIADEAGWSIPETVRQQLVNGLRGFVAGRITRDSALPTADLAIRKLAAIEALSRHESATPDMLSSISVEPQLWPTSAVLDWASILSRVSSIPENASRLAEAKRIVRSRLNFQGTTMGFSTEARDRLWWLMISGDVNAARAVLTVLDDVAWQEDMPRMVRALLGRQRKGHWDTTTANAWGVLALEKFSARFESVPVTGQTGIALAGERRVVRWQDAASPREVELPFGTGRATLAVNHAGTGRPWVMIQSKAALPLAEPLFTGYSIRRTVVPVEQQRPGVWSRGDVARVTLTLDAQSDMTWVVVDDPVPAGATILGNALGRDSSILSRSERGSGGAYPAFEERRSDAYRAYYEYVPKGQWTLEYTLRFNTPGTFTLPATRVEAMYAPEMLGELPNAALTVLASP